MKFLLQIISFFFISFIFILESFAIDAPSNFKIESLSGNVVNFQWDTVDDGYMYYISYGKESGIDVGYENQTDFIENNTGVIEGLEEGNKYYFSVVALDDGGNESVFSEELSIYIDNGSIEENDFALESVNVLSLKEIELKFNDTLENIEGTEREFRIYNKNDEQDSFDVLSMELNESDNSLINLTLDREIEEGVEYELIIIAIKNSLGENIKSGIDSIESFSYNEEMNSAGEEENSTGSTEDDSAGEEENSTGNIEDEILIENQGPSSANLESDELKQTTLGAAGSTSQLPKTGPEHILMLILSIILGSLVFIFKYKKI